ncbi:hypothetical protein BA6E_101184 [Bacteroidales bacterium 6E]|nr:hypothetical protein BA6E_101184 [Bacteroidales bacterium 6E]
MSQIREIVDSIIKAERKHGLFNIKYKDEYPIWPFYRMYFYFGYREFLDNTQKRIGFKKTKILNSIKRFLVLLYYSRLFTLWFPQNKRFLIFSSQRYVNKQEIYTKDLKEIIKNDYIELSLSDNFVFEKGPIYLDYLKVILKILSFLISRFTKSPQSIISFMDELNAPPKFINEFKRYKLEYALWFNIFNIILKIQKPHKVFFVSGTYLTPLVASAIFNRIEIYEIQHGVINNLHLAYQFPDLKRDGFYSDGLLLFSDYWKNKANFPIGTKLLVTGNNTYANQSECPKRKTITLLNQPNATSYLLEFLTTNINFLNNIGYKTYYKLHPSEYSDWQYKYSKLRELNEAKEIEVITNEIPLNELLEESEYIFGVSSTAIYEGLDRKCKAFIIKAPTFTYFEDLIEKGIVKLLYPNSKLTIEILKFQPKEYDNFFSPTNIANWRELLEFKKYPNIR